MRISDWSSDVCSSDLIRCAGSVLRSVSLEHVRVRVVLAGAALGEAELQGQAVARVGGAQRGFALDPAFLVEPEPALVERLHRSEERRLGKARVSTCRSRWSPHPHHPPPPPPPP